MLINISLTVMTGCLLVIKVVRGIIWRPIYNKWKLSWSHVQYKYVYKSLQYCIRDLRDNVTTYLVDKVTHLLIVNVIICLIADSDPALHTREILRIIFYWCSINKMASQPSHTIAPHQTIQKKAITSWIVPYLLVINLDYQFTSFYLCLPKFGTS